MSEYLRRFLRDYPGMADAQHVYHVETEYNVSRNGARHIIGVSAKSSVHFTRLDTEEVASITLPMDEVGLFLYGLELYKMGKK
ncbi:hypothetical protein IDM48_04400 [Rothia amarae]|uniref:Uncharacterized protein n=1 Tax=Rothia amarae TaxID=169480 RepID=A0A7H2BLV3_9MICC|nr:hypothetical protein [Rothia amarae]QNV40649.1 hypothetical protein IDM48_04400 [Rothia amarae]